MFFNNRDARSFLLLPVTVMLVVPVLRVVRVHRLCIVIKSKERTSVQFQHAEHRVTHREIFKRLSSIFSITQVLLRRYAKLTKSLKSLLPAVTNIVVFAVSVRKYVGTGYSREKLKLNKYKNCEIWNLSKLSTYTPGTFQRHIPCKNSIDNWSYLICQRN